MQKKLASLYTKVGKKKTDEKPVNNVRVDEHDLFSLFTANIIKKNVTFTR
jgi:hypothetical protein